MQNVSLSDVYMQFNIDLHHINNVFWDIKVNIILVAAYRH
jgi:hypothetical protein